MRSCQDYEALISAYLDGGLDEKEKRELEDHLALCPACRDYLEDIRAIRGLLTDSMPAAPAGFLDSVLDALPEQKTGKTRTFPLWKRLVAAAACLMLVITGVWIAFPGGESAPASGTDQPMARAASFSMEGDMAAPAAEQTALELVVTAAEGDHLLCTDDRGGEVDVVWDGDASLVNGLPAAGDRILVVPMEGENPGEGGVLPALTVEILP